MHVMAYFRLRAQRLVVVLIGIAMVAVGLAIPAAADSFGCPCSLFGPTDAPTGADIEAPDSASVELGVRFTVDAAAPITGLRFYKGPDNTGTHVGSIWSASGTLLASATFTAESASGWQQVNFATPVATVPGTPYIASYFAPAGHYSETDHYFNSGRDAGILHAPGGSSDAPNGSYLYTPVPAFPNASFNNSNYWVDVVVGTTTTLASIAISPSPLNLVKGATAQLTATGTYSDSTSKDVTSQATWQSNDSSVATVSATGLVSAVGPGTTTVSATVDGVTKSVPVSVKAVRSVAVTGLTASLAAGQQRQLTATAAYTDGSSDDVTNSVVWSSSNPAAARVSPTGLLTGAAAGTAIISATLGGVSGTAKATVAPATIVAVTVTPGSATLRTARLLSLSATATYTDGSTRAVTSSATWRSSNVLSAIVLSGPLLGGTVQGVLPGRAVVSAAVGGVVGSCSISVTLF